MTENFTGTVDSGASYDFRSFGQSWYDPINSFMTAIDNTLILSKEFLDNVGNFILNPIVGIFEDVLEPVGAGAPASLDFFRLSYILSFQVFNSRYTLVADVLTNDERTYIASFLWIEDPVLNYYFNFSRWWLGCLCEEPSLQSIAAAY